MKSQRKPGPNFAVDELSSPWVVKNQDRSTTTKYFDSDSKCTASTADSSSYDYSSSSSSSSYSSLPPPKCKKKRPLATSKNSTHHREPTTTTTTTTTRTHRIQAKQQSTNSSKCRKGTQLSEPIRQFEIDSIPSPLLIPKALRDHCGTGIYWTVPTTKRRRTRDGNRCTDLGRTAKMVSPVARKSRRLDQSLNINAVEDRSNRNTIGNGSQLTKRVRKHSLKTAISDDSKTYSSSNINIAHSKANNKVRMIGIPGVLSRWAWIDTEKKEKALPTRCKTRNSISNGTNRVNTDNSTKTELSSEATAKIANKSDLIHTMNKPPHRSVSKCLKALQDHCGQGTYWIKPTRPRRLAPPSKWEESVDFMNGDGSTISGCSNNIFRICTRKERNGISMILDHEKEKIYSSMTRNTIVKSGNAARTQCIRNTDDTSMITRKGTGRSSDCVDRNKSKASNRISETRTITVASTAENLICETKDAFDHQKTIYRAKEGPNKRIERYALDLISLVCNNSYSVDGSVHRASQHSRNSCSFQQVHRILDKPPRGYTIETESERERLMRLQFRQRFASATSTGMSPIEFAKKLLSLWGGRLDEIVSTEDTNSHVVDKAVDSKEVGKRND